MWMSCVHVCHDVNVFRCVCAHGVSAFCCVSFGGSTTIVTFSIYLLISVPSYIRFGNNTCDDILLNFKLNGTASSSDCKYTLPNESMLDQVRMCVCVRACVIFFLSLIHI